MEYFSNFGNLMEIAPGVQTNIKYHMMKFSLNNLIFKTLLGLASLLLVSCSSSEYEKPNIIFILADDMSYYDLSGLGQKQFSTPHIDQLMDQGLFFTESYAGSPECAPSRASLMTGYHMGHCRIRNNRSVRKQDHLLDSDITVAEMLKSAGYTTGMVGKWGNGLPGSEGTPDKQGFDYSFGFYDQLRAHGYYPHYLMENGKAVAIPENYGFDMERTYQHTRSAEGLHTYDDNGMLVPDGIKDPSMAINSQNYIHRKGLQFIRDHHSNPFFLYYATQLPHGPCITPDLGKFKDKSWDQKHKEWAAMMEHLDRHVGEIVETLKELEILDQTVIFFASDNGYSQWGYFGRKRWENDSIFNNKGPWRGGKFLPMDGGVRIPFLVNWPGKISPGSSDEVVALYDFPATACELAGIETPITDGKSLVPLILGKSQGEDLHQYLYWENGSFGPHSQATRFRNWFAFREHPEKPLQLWDLSSDISCKNDVAHSNKEIVEEALQIFNESHTSSEWYVNPGESKELIERKRIKAESAGMIQEPVRANSRTPEG